MPQTNNNFQRKLIDLASFSCYFERIKSQHNLLFSFSFFFFHVPVEQLLNPSVHLASLTGLGSCTRPLLMPVDCLWQALMQTPWLPWAITLNTQERARAGLTCGRVRGREGARETEGEEHLGGKRNTPQPILDYAKFFSFFFFSWATLKLTLRMSRVKAVITRTRSGS